MARIDFATDNIRWSDANSLRIVRTDTASGYKQNKDDYLVSELIYPSFSYNFCYFTKFKTGRQILNQIAVRIGTLTITEFGLYDLEDNLVSDLTGDLTAVKTQNTNEYGNVTWYNHIISTSGLDGYYRIKITMSNGQIYESEAFYVFAFTDVDGILVEWYNNAISKNNDGIYYSDTSRYGIYLDGRIYKSNLGGEETKGRNYNNSPTLFKGIPNRIDVIEYGAVHWWVAEKLNIGLKHDNFFINNKEYVADGAVSDENSEVGVTGSFIHKGTLEIELKGYQDFEELTTVEAVVENNILWGPNEADYVKYTDDDADRLIYKNE